MIRTLTNVLAPSSVIITLCFAPVAVSAQTSFQRNELAAMQEVIDQQQSEIRQQKQALETQQQKLADQQKMLEALQSQMQSLMAGQDSVDDATEPADVTDAADVTVSRDDQAGSTAGSVADNTQPADTSDAKAPVRIAHSVGANERPNQHQMVLASAPLDIPDDTGLFIFSNDSHKMIRLYGSMRMLSILDNRQNFHPYDLNIPQVPVGAADVRDVNSDWSVKISRLGLEVDVRDLMTIKAEFDWKGDGGESLRIRHMYMRTNHWLVGQHWNALNTVPFLPQSIDSHSTSAHVGARPAQFKYMGKSNNWSYETSLEYFQPKVAGPDSIDAKSGNVIPNLVGHIDYNRPWGKVRAGTMITSNKVKFDDGSESSDVGLAFLLGAIIHLDENNLIKTHLIRTDGNSTYIPDYSTGGQKVDMAFNPASNEFSNLKTLGGQIDWSTSGITTSAAASVVVS
jgi:hypothetical protein